MKLNNSSVFKKFALYFLTFLAVTIVGSEIFSIINKNIVTTVSAQQDPFLSQRISQIERQVNSLESRLIRLETDVRFSTPTSRIGENNNAEVQLLKSQVDLLQSQLSEVGCGLLKIDERTLTNTARQARTKSAVTDVNERCRLNPNTSIEIYFRP